MNTKLSKIFKSFEDVKLEKHDVELGIKEDAETLIKQTKQTRNEIENVKKQVRSAIDSLKLKYKDLNTQATNAGVAIEKYEKAAKDLGLDIPPNIKSDISLLKDHQKLGNNKQAELTKIVL